MNTEDKKLIYILIGLPAIVFALFLGIYIGEHNNNADKASVISSVDSDQISDKDFAPFWKAWKVLDEKFVTAGSTTPQTRIYGAIQGLASSYGDPYTVFFPPVESKMFQEEITGDFEGVGMEIGVKNKQLQVVSPLKGSPADKAGVKTGDYILTIDGKPASSMSTDEAVKLIRGPKGTEVKISFLPSGSTKPVLRTIVRDKISIPTIDTTIKSPLSGNIATKYGDTTIKTDDIFVISLYSFTSQSANLFRNALREFVVSGKHKLVLDLRGNPGGYLDAAVDMASWFLPAGKVVVTEDFGKNGSPNIFRSRGYDIFNNNLEMMILIDGGSASASEILAGALKEQGIAKLVGTKTFGKGSVQELVPITSDTSLKVTIARWLTPNGHNLSNDGLEPDYLVEITDKDVVAKKDVIMEKAIQLLKEMP